MRLLFRERLGRAFEKREYTVFLAANYDEAMQIILREKPEMAVVDMKMPGKSGLELIKDGLADPPRNADRGSHGLRKHCHGNRGGQTGGDLLSAQAGRCR